MKKPAKEFPYVLFFQTTSRATGSNFSEEGTQIEMLGFELSGGMLVDKLNNEKLYEYGITVKKETDKTREYESTINVVTERIVIDRLSTDPIYILWIRIDRSSGGNYLDGRASHTISSLALEENVVARKDVQIGLYRATSAGNTLKLLSLYFSESISEE